MQNLKKILAPDADAFLSGHNDPLSIADIQALVASFEERPAKVKALIQEGKSRDEVQQAFALADAPPQAAGPWPTFIDVNLTELTQKP